MCYLRFLCMTYLYPLWPLLVGQQVQRGTPVSLALKRTRSIFYQVPCLWVTCVKDTGAGGASLRSLSSLLFKVLSPSVRLPCDLSAIWQRAGCFPEIHSTVDWILSQHLCFEYIIHTDKVIPGNDGPWKTDKGVTCSSYGVKWGRLPLICHSTPSHWWRIFILIPNTHSCDTS